MAPVDRKNPKRAKSSESQYSLMEFVQRFADDDACLDYLWRTRFAVGDDAHAHCPKCEEIREFKHYSGKQQRQAWTCIACGYYLYPTAGTIYHKSSTSLHLWFYALYLMASTRCGISAKQLERELGVTYKTAWRIFTKIRNQVMTPDNEPLRRAVEMDEMYVGGKPRQADRNAWDKLPTSTQRRQAAHRWSEERKTPVFGMAQRNGARLPDQKPRGGKVVAHVVPKQPQAAIMAHISATVQPSTVLYTNDARIYDRLGRDGWDHRTINHSAHTYAVGDIHTNSIEGFWGLVKTGILGTHHHVSAKWLQGYVNEYAWRYNHRDDPRAMFELLIFRAATTVVA